MGMTAAAVHCLGGKCLTVQLMTLQVFGPGINLVAAGMLAHKLARRPFATCALIPRAIGIGGGHLAICAHRAGKRPLHSGLAPGKEVTAKRADKLRLAWVERGGNIWGDK